MKSTTSLYCCALIFAVIGFAGDHTLGQVTLDYSHDAAGFFTTNTTAKAALEAAASDINGVINSTLSPVSAADYSIVGSAGSPNVSTSTYTSSYAYTNPQTGGSQTYTGALGNEVRIFVGSRLLGGTTLGQGGPGGFSVGRSDSFFNVTDRDAARADGAAQVTAAFNRGGVGPQSNLTIGGNTITVGLGVGNLWFDSDTDNNGAADGAAVLNSNWHFDHTTAVAGGKSDFYSVALHEILHSLGVGTSDSWNANVSGSDWTGAEVIAAHGSGTGLVTGGHFADGTMSTRLSDGAIQEILMDPNITVGTRKELTVLDAAILRDIGWSTAAVPEPNSFAMLLALGAFATIRRSRS